MDHLHEPPRSTPVVGEYDVCVIGGSCTGVFAAVAAARRGARVALLESFGYLGGTATASLVVIWHTCLDTKLEQHIWAGLTAECLDRLRRRDGVLDQPPSASSHFVLQPAELAIELDELAAEAGVRTYLHTRFVQPVVEEGRVTAAIFEDKTGRRAVRARIFIDASGDADLAHRAGLPTWHLPHLQPPTACALLEGLRQLGPDFRLGQTVFDPRYPEALRPGFLWGAYLRGADTFMVAGTRVHGCDASDADQLTAAEIEGRRQLRAMVDLLRRHVPGGDRVVLQALPARIGIRQTRQVEGLHRLTEHEVLDGVRFPDAVANGSYRVDVHAADGDGLVFRYLDGREDWVSCDGRSTRGRWCDPRDPEPTFYQIPYRSLVPRGAVNVLVAGRCLDADEGAFGAARVMVNCNQMGEAAGTAAALALDADVPVAAVDPARLRDALAAQGNVVL